MKKLLCLVLAVMMLTPAVCFAQNSGDLAGNYYYTDISTYLRGEILESYNVGGKTVIVCEALSNYGFNVEWKGDTRVLEITDVHLTAKGSENNTESGVLGSVAGEYYYTDIVTKFNGTEIESYNIGGKTVIPATSLRDLGYSVLWDEEGRNVLIETDKSSVVSGSTVFDNLTYNENATYHGNYTLRTNAVCFNGVQLVTDNDCLIETSFDKKIFVPFTAFANSLDIKYGWNSLTSTITVKVPDDDVIKPENSKAKSNIKTYGAIEYEIHDIVLNISKDGKTFSNLNAIVYGTEVFIEAQDLANALGFYCFNETEFFTETSVYYLYKTNYLKQSI